MPPLGITSFCSRDRIVNLAFSPTKCFHVFHPLVTSFPSPFPTLMSYHLPVPRCPPPILTQGFLAQPDPAQIAVLYHNIHNPFQSVSVFYLDHHHITALNLSLVPTAEGDPKKKKVGECRTRLLWVELWLRGTGGEHHSFKTWSCFFRQRPKHHNSISGAEVVSPFFPLSSMCF